MGCCYGDEAEKDKDEEVTESRVSIGFGTSGIADACGDRCDPDGHDRPARDDDEIDSDERGEQAV